MSFPQLLAANRAVNGHKTGPNSYRMNQESLLPRFGSGSSASTQAPSPVAPGRTTPQDLSLFEPKPELKSEAKAVPAFPAIEQRQVAAMENLLERTTTSMLTASPAAPAKKSRWRLIEILFLRRKASSPSVRPVQTEWALDKVTVVRNDLADADLEVIPGRPASTAPAPKARSVQPGLLGKFLRIHRGEA